LDYLEFQLESTRLNFNHNKLDQSCETFN